MHVLSHYLSTIDILARVDEELATILQLVDGVSVGIARLKGYHRTIGAALYVALVWLILLETMRHDCLAL